MELFKEMDYEEHQHDYYNSQIGSYRRKPNSR